MMNIHDFMIELMNHPDLTVDALMHEKRKFAKIHALKDMPSNADLIREYHQALRTGIVQKNKQFERAIRKRAIRSQSGIVSVQVLTKPFWCPGKCIFCPNDPTMPKSYIKTEPGAMRAYLNAFDPIRQVLSRLKSLSLTGHDVDKVEMIVLGGTRDVYPQSYKDEFINRLYQACNLFPAFWKRREAQNYDLPTAQDFKDKHQSILDKKPQQETIFDEFFATIGGCPPRSDPQLGKKSSQPAGEQQSQKKTINPIRDNEQASVRIIGLTIETRPEYVTDTSCRQWRDRGVTRLEIGVQSTNDAVLEANKRDNTYAQYKDSMHKLRQYGFKFSTHIMPGLYKASYETDRQTFVDIFSDPHCKPDEIKLYPTSVIPNTELHTLYTQGLYTPLTTDDIARLVKEVFATIIPPYTRIKRFIRDIPATEIVAGSSITNLAQLLQHKRKKELAADPDARTSLYQRLDTDPHFLTSMIPRGSDRTPSNQELSIQETPTKERITRDYTSGRNFIGLDTRSREVRHKKPSSEQESLVLCERIYDTSCGTEHFLSVEDHLGYLYAILRLSLPSADQTIDYPGLGKHTALIRELHVYGQMQQIGSDHQNDQTQHRGLGSGLLLYAQAIAQHHDYTKLSIIAGVGVREYYTRQGFVLEGTYMIKDL